MIIIFSSIKPTLISVKRNHNTYKALLPNEISTFLYHYKYSKFMDCNRTLAESNVGKIINGNIYKQNPVSNSKILEGLLEINEIFENQNKPYWITDGTLLGMKLNLSRIFFIFYSLHSINFKGWYRDCGVIPHTTGNFQNLSCWQVWVNIF